MGATFSLGRILGIPVSVSYTWFVVLGLVSYVLFGQLSMQLPRWDMLPLVGMAAATGLLFFVSVLAHELAHSLTATRHGIPVRGITLFMLGGVSHIAMEARRPWIEFTVALVGPALSLVLGGLLMGFAFYVAPAFLEGRLRDGVMVVAFLLGWTNLALGVFNLLPGFPLDGGRVLRAGLWGLTGNYWLATSIAVLVAQVFAVALTLLSIFLFIRTGNFLNLWPILIAGFVFYMAVSAKSAARDRRQLTGVTVGEVASADMVPADATIADAVRARLTRGGRAAVLVGVESVPAGVLHEQELRGVPRGVWGITSPMQAMVPLSSFPVVDAGEPAIEALEVLEDDDGPPCLVVVAGGRIVGIVTRSDLDDYLRGRRTLDMAH
ncbi:MAG: site-2 protease family protein [Chloroflexota bacterium]|nr:site-2 protease family protein [Chloroflexota bacterium]MDE2970583.1 site-2 protease family protein [Chloroflexota bacterium]